MNHSIIVEKSEKDAKAASDPEIMRLLKRVSSMLQTRAAWRPHGQAELNISIADLGQIEGQLTSAIRGLTAKQGYSHGEVSAQSEREQFEEAAFGQYFMSTIQKNPATGPKISGCMDFVSVDCKTSAEFLAKDKVGKYLEATLNSAWWAWQEARKRLPRLNVAEAEERLENSNDGRPPSRTLAV